MKDSIVTVNCQSYSASEPGARMKPSGLTQFQFKVDMYDWMYDREGIENVVTDLVSKMCNDYERFEIANFEFQPSAPLELLGFDEAYDEYCNEPHYDQDRQSEDMDAWAGTF